MVTEAEYLRRIKDGLPIDEARNLLDKVHLERAKKKQPETNPYTFKDPQVQKFSDLWFSQQSTATVEQKNKVGLAYISTCLGFGDEIAQKFADGDNSAFSEVGRKQSALFKGISTTAFWQDIAQIFPDTYTKDDILFLSRVGIEGVLHFQSQIEIPLAEESPILRSLAINAHAYK